MGARQVLFFDVETAPLLAHIWHPKQEYVREDMLLETETFLLTWAAKWRGVKKIESMRMTTQEARDQDDTRLAAGLADLIRRADVVVAHNGDRFDLRILNSRLLVHGLEPTGPVESIDTLRIAKRSFRLSYNNLDYLGRILGVGQKVKHHGFKMWRDAYLGDEPALKKMERYNRGDVRLLEDVFERLVPHAAGIPRLTISHGFACAFCGSDDVQRRGYHTTGVHQYAKFKCNQCMRYSRTRNAATDGIRPELAPLR